MYIKKQIALAAISQALANKTAHMSAKSFINGKYASNFDITVLHERINCGKELLRGARVDKQGNWHFTTA
jgi:hypothetical protein